jgi:hypothetical protein
VKLLVLAQFLAALWLQPLESVATEQSVLLVNVHGFGSYPYNADAFNVYRTLTNAGAIATWADLDINGEVAQLISSNNYDQIWIFDLSLGEDAYASDWESIATWFNSKSNLPIICDGRILSSYWYGRWTSEGQRLSGNYYQNLKERGGGLVLGTDHSYGTPDIGSYTRGINSVNALIGLNLFVSQFALPSIPVDTNSPLMNYPTNLGSFLSNDSTTSQAPFGLQPNGRMLHTVAWHSGNLYTPGITTTIEKTQGLQVWITSPAPGSTVLISQPVTFSVDQTNGSAPFTYTWTSDKDGLLGTGSNLVYSSLSSGVHAITVTGVDSGSQIDTDSILLNVSADILNIAHAVELWWASASGVTYQVQWTPAVGPTNWQNLNGPVSGTGGTNSVFDSTRGQEKRFYRLLVQ